MNNRLRKPATLKEIAALAGVTSPTVSRVLRGSPETRVSNETREKILRFAKEMNYRPNMLARSLKNQSTNVLNFFVPDIGSPVFPEIIRGAENAATERHYCLFISHLDEDSIRRKRYLTLIQDRLIGGLVLAVAGDADDVIKDLVDANAPFILVNRKVPFSQNHVIVDDTAGVRLGIRHLVELGHKKIGYISGRLTIDTAVRRLQGYKDALAEFNIAYDEKLVEESSWFDFSDGKNALFNMLARTSPTAIFASNQTIAVGAISGLQEAGLKIPQDISVMGLHDSPLASIAVPSLTVVKMPLYEMGYRAINALINLITGGDPGVPLVLPPAGLIVRNSTARRT
jgi:LacI family transcriptional regulator